MQIIRKKLFFRKKSPTTVSYTIGLHGNTIPSTNDKVNLIYCSIIVICNNINNQ